MHTRQIVYSNSIDLIMKCNLRRQFTGTKNISVNQDQVIINLRQKITDIDLLNMKQLGKDRYIS